MYILGASGHAKSVIDVLPDLKVVKTIYDDDPKVDELMGIPVKYSSEINWDKTELGFVAIGDNKNRMKVAERLRNYFDYINLIHQSAFISRFADLSKGIVVMEGAIIKVDSYVGNHVIVNTGARVDHDCRLGDYVHIAPGVTLCGNVMIGEGSLVGAGSVVLPGITIGNWVTIGAGSVVHKNIPDGGKWIGDNLG
ncbi:MAG: acetyltransferase [Mongoliibacter sp.]|uniref:acetyltransferase n=1 Tax=Mongoliibacter sp. TaxID=2022438 RepID=UPI0012F11BAE|nr:acetyltransferase [Mongoliibacter sp.]TVP47425.1 MAG: acetyltransferase [Mongoliibacter sp.]